MVQTLKVDCEIVAKKTSPKDFEIATQYVSAFSHSTATCMLGKNKIHWKTNCRHHSCVATSDLRVEMEEET